MCITEEQLIDAYGKGSPHERFILIYKNYEVFLQLVNCYETGLFNRILYEREYNRRAAIGADDLGVRVQTSYHGDPTATKAIERMMIHEAIEKCDFSGDILKDTDTPEKHRRDILTIRMMRREFEVFENSLKALPGKEYKITYRYLSKECDVTQIAVDEDRADQTIRNILAMTRKTLEHRTIPYFRDSI